jgi:hypothetical protein
MRLADISIGQAGPSKKTIKVFGGAGLFLQIEPSDGK